MIKAHIFEYTPGEHEAEKASNSYLISLISFIGGFPLPIINLIATLVFYIGNRRKTYFVRWHCTQALLSQFFILPFNSFGFWWTISIIFTDAKISSNYLAYILTILLLNALECITTIYTAIVIRKGKHVEWWFLGGLTNLLCKK